jgi:hypothetical protein
MTKCIVAPVSLALLLATTSLMPWSVAARVPRDASAAKDGETAWDDSITVPDPAAEEDGDFAWIAADCYVLVAGSDSSPPCFDVEPLLHCDLFGDRDCSLTFVAERRECDRRGDCSVLDDEWVVEESFRLDRRHKFRLRKDGDKVRIEIRVDGATAFEMSGVEVPLDNRTARQLEYVGYARARRPAAPGGTAASAGSSAARDTIIDEFRAGAYCTVKYDVYE